ncbi:hypothetical protein HJFPF1_03801 [Paramyrothecium foliicola]|nr:hypothetical protein HJFPF1_03801 [Paramyrothecium foliicola]
MVQLMPSAPYSNNGAADQTNSEERRGKQEGKMMTREEHAQRIRELNMKRGIMRAPRRGWSLTDYQGDHVAGHHLSQPATAVAVIPENEPLAMSKAPSPTSPSTPIQEKTIQLPQRPKLPTPRRSYSVTDHEPIPHGQPRPSARLGLLDLPSELHYNLFDFLDPIDGACLGLAHSKLYAIHRRKNGKVPLCSRYSGPNDMEWAWRGASPLVHPVTTPASVKERELEQLRVKGQVYCRKCGISRCELHRHLKDWMGADYQYCEIKQIFGKPAGDEAKPYCFMSSPKNPHRCGRHGGKKAHAVN